jgi:uncharacterized protein (DUF433 family)
VPVERRPGAGLLEADSGYALGVLRGRGLPESGRGPVGRRLHESLGAPRFCSRLFLTFCLLALALARVGIHAVTASSVAWGTREVGVRIALGARGRAVVGEVVRAASRPAVAGLAIGLLAALALTQALRGLLFGLGPTDPATFALSAAVLLAAALLADWLPARRAAGADPVVPLGESRCEGYTRSRRDGAMPLALATDPTPIHVDSDGAVRVGQTRVRLESIVYRHQQGDTPEEIHECFPAVPLPDIYVVVAYYLRHKEELDAYIAESEAEADRIQAMIEAKYPTRELRERSRALRDRT